MPSAPGDEVAENDPRTRSPHLLDGLRWQNYDQPITFPYLAEFSEVELKGVRFTGQPDFELVLGYDRFHPEEVLRIYFGVGQPNRKIIQRLKSGQVIEVATEGDPVDFTLNEKDRYLVRLKREATNQKGEVWFGLTIQLDLEDKWQDRCLLSFCIDEENLPRGQIALRGEGNLSVWTVAIDSVLIVGRLDYERTAQELLGREGT